MEDYEDYDRDDGGDYAQSESEKDLEDILGEIGHRTVRFRVTESEDEVKGEDAEGLSLDDNDFEDIYSMAETEPASHFTLPSGKGEVVDDPEFDPYGFSSSSGSGSGYSGSTSGSSASWDSVSLPSEATGGTAYDPAVKKGKGSASGDARRKDHFFSDDVASGPEQASQYARRGAVVAAEYGMDETSVYDHLTNALNSNTAWVTSLVAGPPVEYVPQNKKDLIAHRLVSFLAKTRTRKLGAESHWLALDQKSKDTLVAVVSLWLDQGVEARRILIEVADIFSMRVDFLQGLLGIIFPNSILNVDDSSLISTARTISTVGGALQELETLVYAPVGQIFPEKKSDLPVFVKPDSIVTTDETIMYSSLSYFVYLLAMPVTLSDVTTLTPDELFDLAKLFAEETRLGLIDVDEYVVRGQELLAEFSILKVLGRPGEGAPWRRFMVKKNEDGTPTALARASISSEPLMYYSREYPRSYVRTSYCVCLGSDDLLFRAEGYEAYEVPHPLAPLEKDKTFLVMQLFMTSDKLSPAVFARKIEKRMMSNAKCYVYALDRPLRRYYLGDSTTFFLDGSAFVFCVALSENVLGEGRPSLHPTACPTVMFKLPFSVACCPCMITPVKVYRILQRAVLLKEVYDQIAASKREAAAKKKRPDPSWDGQIVVHLSRDLLFYDQYFAGLRSFLCVMLGIGLVENSFPPRPILDSLRASFSVRGRTGVPPEDLYFKFFRAGGSRSPEEALAICLSYFHVITTVRMYQAVKEIFVYADLKESTTTLSSMRATLTHLRSKFKDKVFAAQYLDVVLKISQFYSSVPPLDFF
jgi:hypothetical protein